jgi:hypothetical protein
VRKISRILIWSLPAHLKTCVSAPGRSAGHLL